jgi:hypothetical protein
MVGVVVGFRRAEHAAPNDTINAQHSNSELSSGASRSHQLEHDANNAATTVQHSHSLLVLLDLHAPCAGQSGQVDRLEELHLPRVAPAVGDLGPLGQLDVGVLDALVVPVSVVW